MFGDASFEVQMAMLAAESGVILILLWILRHDSIRRNLCRLSDRSLSPPSATSGLPTSLRSNFPPPP